jgi:hypothetical protein
VQMDHVIPGCLGGALRFNDAGRRNLWPQPLTDAVRKDVVEQHLCDAVCTGRISIQEAQRRIATNWTTAEGP